MFEQTLLPNPKDARKPYSVVLSLLIQIIALAALCLAPLIFTSVLPAFQLKSVLAAPPKPPVALKSNVPPARTATASLRTFRLTSLSFQVKPAIPAITTRTSEAPPSFDIGDAPATLPGSIAETMPQAPLRQPPPPAREVEKPWKVGGSVAAANLIHKVQPQYPPLARTSGIEGTVEFTAVISKQGTIENLSLVHGHPLLVKAATEAVLEWRYRPTLLNGQPVEVVTNIVVVFTLSR